MKTILFRISLFLMLLVLTTGCVAFEDYIVDWAPVQIVLKAVDSDGNDLLDPKNPDNIIEGTKATFMGKTYDASTLYYDDYWKDEGASVQTKAFLAIMRGLYLISGDHIGYEFSGKGFSLIFGEIDGAADMDEDIVINWANGEVSTIHYHCSNHKEGRNPTCNRYFTLNGGKEDKSSFFTFVFE